MGSYQAENLAAMMPSSAAALAHGQFPVPDLTISSAGCTVESSNLDAAQKFRMDPTNGSAPAPMGMLTPVGTQTASYDVNLAQSDAFRSTGTQFSTDFCECCEGPGAATGYLVALFFPCWAHGIIGDDATNGVGHCAACWASCCCYATNISGAALAPVLGPYHVCFMWPPMLAFWTLDTLGRKKMREKYGIPGDTCPDDCCLMFWCQSCALAQEMRHIRTSAKDGNLSLLGNWSNDRKDLTFFQRSAAPYLRI